MRPFAHHAESPARRSVSPELDDAGGLREGARRRLVDAARPFHGNVVALSLAARAGLRRRARDRGRWLAAVPIELEYESPVDRMIGGRGSFFFHTMGLGRVELQIGRASCRERV